MPASSITTGIRELSHIYFAAVVTLKNTGIILSMSLWQMLLTAHSTTTSLLISCQQKLTGVRIQLEKHSRKVRVNSDWYNMYTFLL